MNLSTFTLAAIVALGATTETIATARIGRNLSYDATKCANQNIALSEGRGTSLTGSATSSGQIKSGFTADECSDLGGNKWIYGFKNCDNSALNSETDLCYGKNCYAKEYTGAAVAGCTYFYESGAFAYGVGASITAVAGATLVLLS
eukprot:CAMPEP_0198256420 /NCGR_PEP_ID=MMETSP1447-20131203/6341_1 /TAXON_ID=420782 /ORGANISM="Chaetoceros dichaeta, Strain CCMP1751" /LENGTH=145 /DNA_ID=CAMNT_0043943065 /DNA_START=24 /DNA_END=461 /DNA_ORIENTATION=-